MKTKFLVVILLLCVSIFTLIAGCADGTDSVDFVYSPNSTDIKTINFKALGKSDFGTFEYSWNFGDGKKSTGEEVSHTFEKFGKYNVILTATIEESNIVTQVQKEIEIEVPIISNINITGKASSKGANIIEYVISSVSDYDNEIEYNWQFDDGTTATGQMVSRVMSSWPDGDNFGNITDRIMVSVYIPSLDYTFKSNELYNVTIEKPKINNFDINCTNEGTAGERIFNCDVRKNGVNPTATVGRLTYEWIFNGEVRSGDTQTFTLTQNNYDYPVYVTATIDGTNISETRKATINVPIDKDDINFNCSTAIVNDNHEDALKIKCQPQYNKATFLNPSINWHMGDDSLNLESTGNAVIEHIYKQAGIYNITMEFVAENNPEPIAISKKQTVLVNLYTSTSFDKNTNAGTHSCSNGAIRTYRVGRVFLNNFNLFRQDDFDIYSSFSSGNFNCEGQSGGWNKNTVNVWDAAGSEFGTFWGDWDQHGSFILCPKGVSKDSQECIKSSF